MIKTVSRIHARIDEAVEMVSAPIADGEAFIDNDTWPTARRRLFTNPS